MVIKVQVSLSSTDNIPHMLIYNEDRTVHYEDFASKDILELMGDEPKAYFNADLIDDPANKNAKRISITSRAKWQNW